MIADAHSVLGVSMDAEAHEVHEAWRRLCAIYDPERFEDAPDEVKTAAADQLKNVNDAYIQLLQTSPSTTAIGTSVAGDVRRNGKRHRIAFVFGICILVLALAGAAVVYSGRQGDESGAASRKGQERLTDAASTTLTTPATVAPSPTCPPSGTVQWIVDKLETEETSAGYGGISPAVYQVHAAGRLVNATDAPILAATFVDLIDADGRKGLVPSTVTFVDSAGNAVTPSTLESGQSASWVLETYSRIQQPDGTFGSAPTRIEPEPVASLIRPDCFVSPVPTS